MSKAKGIRGLDLELYKQAKAQAALEGKTLAKWISEAIAKALK